MNESDQMFTHRIFPHATIISRLGLSLILRFDLLLCGGDYASFPVPGEFLSTLPEDVRRAQTQAKGFQAAH